MNRIETIKQSIKEIQQQVEADETIDVSIKFQIREELNEMEQTIDYIDRLIKIKKVEGMK